MELIYKLGLAALFIFACSLTIAVTYSQTTDEPCKSPEASQFDFWIGEWEAFGVKGAKAGNSKITVLLDSCVILEEWTSAGTQQGLIYSG